MWIKQVLKTVVTCCKSEYGADAKKMVETSQG